MITQVGSQIQDNASTYHHSRPQANILIKNDAMDNISKIIFLYFHNIRRNKKKKRSGSSTPKGQQDCDLKLSGHLITFPPPPIRQSNPTSKDHRQPNT